MHSAASREDFRKSGGPLEAFQLWVNLPKKYKMVPPRYQDIRSNDIPISPLPGGAVGSTVKIVSGNFNGVTGACSTLHPVNFFDIRLKPGDTITMPIPHPNHVAFLYVFRGLCEIIGDVDQTKLRAGQGTSLVDGVQVTVTCPSYTPNVAAPAPHGSGPEYQSVGAAFILLIGVPIFEPLARAGPFVMNTEDEIKQCFLDYRSGKIAADSRVSPNEL